MPTRAVAINAALSAYYANTGLPAVGVAANITTPRWRKDGVAAALANSTASECDATNAPGEYSLQLNAVDTNCNLGKIVANCNATNVVVVGTEYGFYALPTSFALPATVLDVSNTANSVNASVLAASNATNSANTAVTARVLDASNATNSANSALNTSILTRATPLNVTDTQNTIMGRGNAAWITAGGFATPNHVTDARVITDAVVNTARDAVLSAAATNAATATTVNAARDVILSTGNSTWAMVNTTTLAKTTDVTNGTATVTNAINGITVSVTNTDATNIANAVIAGGVASTVDVTNAVTSITNTVTNAGVALKNDAITNAKFDETTAYPVVLPDSGVSAIARLGG